jgi:signal transduction histidine kinase
MKADLITNVSHDIKTPLTSIINYVNLLKMEPIEDKRMTEYINILDEKSQRLKQLTEDLVEASRISSGNITLQMSPINLVELIYQTGGEFNEKFEAKDLTTITKLPKEAAMIMADGRRIWRVVENLYNNVAKYAMAHTRVYVTMEKLEHEVSFAIKNISEQPLNVETTDLTERFVRGDESRTTEGSGLGLSIARNLTTLMGGRFDIELDGDLFTATIIFPLVEE